MPQHARYTLPQEVNPATVRCFVVRVPNDRMYIAAFKGAMYTLSRPYAWQDDPAHTALDVGAVWSEVYAQIEEIDCDMATVQIRASETGCGIEYSTDGGFNWTEIDLSTCISTIADDRIQQGIDDGTIQQPGGQPAPEEPPSPGECKTFHVILAANEKWKVPFAVNSYDTLHITNAHGGWTDGAFLWYCPDGKSYVLNTCGNNNPYQPTDPLQAGNHMQLIGGYNTSTPVYFNPLTSTFVMPSSVVNQECWLQANDQTLYDNTGSVEFDVEICTGAVWEHTFDFAASDGSFALGEAGVWVSGQGWNGTRFDGFSDPEVDIHRSISPDANVIQIDLTYNRSAASGANRQVIIQGKLDTVLVLNTYNSGTQTGNGLVFTWTGAVTIDYLRLGVNSGTGGGTNRIVSCHIVGRGNNPF